MCCDSPDTDMCCDSPTCDLATCVINQLVINQPGVTKPLVTRLLSECNRVKLGSLVFNLCFENPLLIDADRGEVRQEHESLVSEGSLYSVIYLIDFEANQRLNLELENGT